MLTSKMMLKLRRINLPEQYTVINQKRKINVFQKLKDYVNDWCGLEKEKVCDVSPNCCTLRVEEETRPRVADVKYSAPQYSAPQYSAKVVVIGAGMAGLSAAKHLQDNDVNNFTVIEAGCRPGGRILSSWFGDSVIEMGSPMSQFSRNPIVDNLFHDGLLEPVLNRADLSRGLLCQSNGNVIPYPLTLEVYQRFKRIWALAHEMEAAKSGRSKYCLMNFVGSTIEQEARNFPSSHQVDAQRAFHGLVSLVTSKSNHDSSLIKSTELGNFIQLPGSAVKVPLGYVGEIFKLYNTLSKDKVHLCKNVVKIEWGAIPDVFPRGVVICENGDRFPADFVIITIPLGVLKSFSDSIFCPRLPASKFDAILKNPVRYITKIFLEYPQPFWRWNMNFEKKTFDVESMACRDGWLKGVSTVETVLGSNHVVVVTVAGPQAECVECLSDREINSDLSKFLKETYCKAHLPEPLKIQRTSWSRDPRFLGSYTYMGPNVSNCDFYNLASPLPEETDPVLLFAGEATCPTHFGTVEGARISGVREADRLLQLIHHKH